MEQEQLRRYPPVVIFEENDGKFYFRASFKEFPDMIGGIGDTVELAIAAAYDMLDAEIDFREEMGLPVPSPMVFDLSDDPSGRVTVRMSKTLHRRLIEAAEVEGVSLNALINEAIADRLTHRKQQSVSESVPAMEHWQADATVKPWMLTHAQATLKDKASEKMKGIFAGKKVMSAA